jgi:ubiquitin C-terminal hydrolase
MYDLKGIIVHKGEASHGHYYSMVMQESGEWFLLDDEKVA